MKEDLSMGRPPFYITISAITIILRSTKRRIIGCHLDDYVFEENVCRYEPLF